MSDRVRDISKCYQNNVLPTSSRCVGLFPIAEYPESEGGPGMWSSAVGVILTAFRFFAPTTILTVFWGQQSLLFRILKHIDGAIKSILYSSDEQSKSVLGWLEEAGPVKVEHLDTVWRHGWILCGVLDSALPGACAGHPPTRLSLKHAQSIADNYLGVEPIFSQQELESIDSLGKRQEWKLAQYLDRIRQALTKLTPPVTRPTSQRNTPEMPNFIMDYLARGSGLTAAQINNKMYFKIYPAVQQSLDPGEIKVLIRGPKDIYGMTVIPPLLGKAQMIRQKILGLQPQKTFTENVLPITQGAQYLRAYGKNDMNKTFFIPKTIYDIEVEVEILPEYARVGYIVPLEGKYEIYISSKGTQIIGSPYPMTASKNIVEILEKDSFCLEDGEEIDIIDCKNDRKVVLRIVDFVTEKMLLRENGTFEKISERDADVLMTSDIINKNKYRDTVYGKIKKDFKVRRFKDASLKIKCMIEVCNMFKNIVNEKHLAKKTYIQKDIPDIVNSTLYENNNIPKETIPQLIIPNSFTLLLQQEKVKTLLYNASDNTKLDDSATEIPERDQIIDNKHIITPSNEINDIKIVIDLEKNDDAFNVPNPLIEFDRPKTPILKIITGCYNRPDSPFIDPNKDLDNEGNDEIPNEFINPFFIHEHRDVHFDLPDLQSMHPATDFIIGAPVSLPPLLKVPSPEPDMDSIILASNLDEALYKYEMKVQSKKSDETDNTLNNINVLTYGISESEHDASETNASDADTDIVQSISIDNLTFHSIDSNFDEDSETQSNSCGEYSLEEIPCINKDLKCKKDTWDSAYVSIDENNSSPEANNDDTDEMKQKSSVSFAQNVELFSTMGPAEREIWQTCKDLGNEVSKITEDVKVNKWDFKRPIFTPIIEESDRSLSTGLKDSLGPDKSLTHKDDDSVALALAELNEILQEYPNSEMNSLSLEETEENNSKGLDYIVEQNIANVESASEKISDVMRQRKQYLDETISEVQQKVTEFSSASRGLPQKGLYTPTIPNKYSGNETKYKDDKHFGEDCYENLVLERKKYWDDRIRLIEETKSQQQARKKKLTTKNLRHNDSLTKRRGKQIVKKMLTSADSGNMLQKQPEVEINQNITRQFHLDDKNDEVCTDVKLVKKWKKFWDEKLIVENEESSSDPKNRTPKENSSPENKIAHASMTTETIAFSYPKVSSILSQDRIQSSTLCKPPKQEIAEEVFKAFETSPRRFFGTSRKQIMNKIDSFLGKENIAEETIDKNTEKIEHEHGLVFSRISQFRQITTTADLLETKNHIVINNRSKNTPSRVINSVDEEESENYINSPKNQLLKEPDNDIPSSPDLTATQLESDVVKNLAKNIIERLNNNLPIEINSKIKAEKRGELTIKSNKRLPNNDNFSSITRKTTSKKLLSSKSEMDIFSKLNSIDPNDDLDKHKSCEELPKINVKNVISLYETVSKNAITDVEPRTNRSRTVSLNDKLPQNLHAVTISNTGMAEEAKQNIPEALKSHEIILKSNNYKSSKIVKEVYVENNVKPSDNVNKYLKCKKNMLPMETIITDIDIEIVDNIQDTEMHESTESPDDISSNDYKSRFKSAREFFKSFEELRIPNVTTPDKLNECELMLQKTESPKETNKKSKERKKKVKSHSLPSSEFEKIWSQMKVQKTDEDKYVKISEKFNVDDLFNDVVGEGRLSRQGSFKGIPHKKAVLEIFRSMENISNKKMSSYEIAVSQLNEFAKQQNIKNAQTHLTEYPYLPTTDPSKYHSRHDTKASGLISRRELLNNKPRRNSVPDLRLNAKFIVNL